MATIILPQQHVFTSRLPDFDISQLSLGSYVLENVASFYDKPAIVEGKSGRVYNYKELESSIWKFASLLRRLGVRKGDVVMLLLSNCPEFIISFLGTASIGAIVTPANPFCTAKEIEKQMQSSGTKVVVTHAACVGKLQSRMQDGAIEVLVTDEAVQGCHYMFEEQASEEEEEVSVLRAGAGVLASSDVVVLPFSSGTTSLPKGVELTHRNVVSCIGMLVEGDNPNFYLDSTDSMLCVIPMFHIYCMSCILLSCLRVGATIVVMQKYELEPMLGLIERYRITAACFVPPILLAITKNTNTASYDLSSLRFVMSGAAPLGKELEEEFKVRLPSTVIAQGYGMTEAGPLISMSLAFAKNPYPVKSGSCGTVVRNTEAKVVNTETGEPLGPCETGEICIRGPQVMKGYLNNLEATAQTVDKDGWLHTGDIGYIDQDGEMFIVDRVKELIKFKGFPVAPAELEAILVSHPDISDAAVVGKSDEVAGEVPVAFVVRSDGSSISEEEVKSLISSQVVFYKRLHSVVFIGAVPKSAAGKILRKNLRNLLNSAVH